MSLLSFNKPEIIYSPLVNWNEKSSNSNNAGNLIGICIAIVVAVSAWLFVNLSPWIAAGFAISAALTWKIPKGQKNF